jgi:hypothetical protein
MAPNPYFNPVNEIFAIIVLYHNIIVIIYVNVCLYVILKHFA